MEIRKIEIFGFIDGYLQCLKTMTENEEEQKLIKLAIMAASYKYNTPLFRSALRQVLAELEMESE